MTYTVSSGTLNSSIPYHTIQGVKTNTSPESTPLKEEADEVYGHDFSMQQKTGQYAEIEVR